MEIAAAGYKIKQLNKNVLEFTFAGRIYDGNKKYLDLAPLVITFKYDDEYKDIENLKALTNEVLQYIQTSADLVEDKENFQSGFFNELKNSFKRNDLDFKSIKINPIAY